MTKIDILNDTLARTIVCTAIGEEFHLIDHMNLGEGRPLEVQFIVNGVELDFGKVIKAIDEDLDRQVEARAGRLLLDKHWDLIRKLGNIKDYIDDLFPSNDGDD
jgi:hypothetical protein